MAGTSRTPRRTLLSRTKGCKNAFSNNGGSRSSPVCYVSFFLTYANEAVLPFYIMHQTVLLVIGYYVTRWHIPDLLKFVTISGSSFTLIVGVYEFLIRRVNVLRVLFGMKPTIKNRAAISQIESISNVTT
jgi:hypothetical protein